MTGAREGSFGLLTEEKKYLFNFLQEFPLSILSFDLLGDDFIIIVDVATEQPLHCCGLSSGKKKGQ